MSRLTQDTARLALSLLVRGFHSLWPDFPDDSNSSYISLLQSYNPHNAVTFWVWAPALSLAATQAIDVSFFSSSYLDVSVQRVCSRLRVTSFCLPGCPIRISADLFSFANPRGFSQLSTSFFASKSLGIPHTPFSYFIFYLFQFLRIYSYLSVCLTLTQIPNPSRIKYFILAKAQQVTHLILSLNSCQ